MKTALILTTINIPSALALYRRFDTTASVRFFVAIDKKTPASAIQFCDNLGNCEVVHYTNYKCDQVIGDNSIQRRNLALLEALRWGADIIVSVDDDNIPIDPNYFVAFKRLFIELERLVDYKYRVTQKEVGYKFSGLQVSSAAPAGWFDVGILLQPSATHRGYPAQIVPETYFEHVTDARVGVAAGMVLGDPDTSAVERLARSPRVSGVNEILKAGIVVSPTTRTVFNSQNTAFIRELAPAMMMWPGVGRCDDIFASLLCQRVMRDRGLHVHFGRPFVYQQRNPHNFVNDLKQELFGMEHLVRFAEFLDLLKLNPTAQTSVLQDVQAIFEVLEREAWCPKIVSECGLAWCEDIKQVIG